MAAFFTFDAPADVHHHHNQQAQQPHTFFDQQHGNVQAVPLSATPQEQQQQRKPPPLFAHFALASPTQNQAGLGATAAQGPAGLGFYQPAPADASSSSSFFDLHAATQQAYQPQSSATANQASVNYHQTFEQQPAGHNPFQQTAFQQHTNPFEQSTNPFEQSTNPFEQSALQPTSDAFQSIPEPSVVPVGGSQSVFGGFDIARQPIVQQQQQLQKPQNPFLTSALVQPDQNPDQNAQQQYHGYSEGVQQQQPVLQPVLQPPQLSASSSKNRDADQPKWARAADASDVIYGCAWLPTTNTCVIADAQGLLQCVRVGDQGQSFAVACQRKASSAISSLAATSPTSVCCASADGTVTAWDLHANRTQQLLGSFGQLVAYEQQRQLLVVGSWSKHVVVKRDLRQPGFSNAAVIKLQGKCHAVDVRGFHVAVGVNTDPSNVQVLIYDARSTAAPALTLQLKPEEGMVRSVALSDRLLVYGTQRGYVGTQVLAASNNEPSRCCFDMLETSRAKQQQHYSRPVSLMVNKVIFSGQDSCVTPQLGVQKKHTHTVNCAVHELNLSAD